MHQDSSRRIRKGHVVEYCGRGRRVLLLSLTAAAVLGMWILPAARADLAPAWVRQYQAPVPAGWPWQQASRMLADGSYMEVMKLGYGGLYLATRYDRSGTRLSTSAPMVIDSSSSAIALGPFGEVYGVGSRLNTSPNDSSTRYYVAWKYDGVTGNPLWTQPAVAAIPNSGSGAISSAAIDSHGDLVAAGSNGSWLVLAKWSGVDGTPLWNRVYSAIAQGPRTQLAIAADDTIAVAAEFGSAVRTLRTDSAGNVIWTRDVSMGSNSMKGIAIATDGSISVTAAGEVAPGDTRVVTVRYDSSGTQLFQATQATGPVLNAFLACDTSGNTIVAATKDTFSNDDIVLVKYGPSGAVLWSQQIATAYDDVAEGISVDGLGHVVLSTKSFNYTTGNDLVAFKFDASSGAMLWTFHDWRDLNIDVGGPVIDSEGNVWVNTTWTTSPRLFRINGSTGGLLWTDLHPNTRGQDRAGACAVDSHGDVVAVVSSESTYVNGAIAIVKYAGDSGAVVWSTKVDTGNRIGTAGDVAVDANDNVYVAGRQYAPDFFILAKFNAAGTFLWSRMIAGPTATAVDVRLDSAGNAVFTGYTYGSNYDVLTAKYDANGNLLWQKAYDSGNSDRPIAMAPDGNGDVVVLIDENANWRVIKYAAADGAIVWSSTYGAGIPGFMTVTAAGDIYVTGRGPAYHVTTKRLTAAGSVVWSTDYSLGVIPTDLLLAGTDVLVAGWTGSSVVPGRGDYAIVRYSSANGAQTSAFTYPGTTKDYFNLPGKVGVDTLGNVVLGGVAYADPRRDDDAMFLKFNPSGTVVAGPLYLDRGLKDRPVTMAMSGDKIFATIATGEWRADAYTVRVDQSFALLTAGDQLPPGNCGRLYAADVVALNGTAPLAWSVVVGALPAGLTLDAATGHIGGTPASIGTSTFRLRVTDATSTPLERDFTIAVDTSDDYFRIIATPNPSCGPTTLSVPSGYAVRQWYPGLETTSTVQITPTQRSTYGVVVDQGGSCVTRGAIDLSVVRLASPTIALSSSPLCSGLTGQASVPSSYASHNWSITNGAIVSGQGTAVIQFTNSGSSSVSLSVQVTTADGCSATSSATVPVQPLADPVISFSSPSACSGGTVQASVAPEYTSYAWSVTNGNITAGQGTSAITIAVTGTSGDLQASVNAVACDNSSRPASATIPLSSMTTPVITGPASICPMAIETASVPSTYSYYSWTVTNGYVSGPSDSSSITFYPDPSGLPVQLAVRVQSGGCEATANTTVPIASLAAPAITAPASICPMAIETASVPSTYSYYSWTVSNGYVSGPSDSSSITFYPDPSGLPVQLAVRVRSGGCEATANTTVPIASLAAPAITAPASICPMAIETASVPSTYSYYSWTVTNGYVSGPSDSSSITFYPDPSGLPVQLAVRVRSGGCEATANTTVPIASLAPPVITAPAAVCPMGMATASVPSTYSDYSWTVTHGYVSGPSNSNSIDFYPDPSGLPVEVAVRVQSGGCAATASTSVPVQAPTAPVMTAPAEICPSYYANGTASVPAAYLDYYWTVSNGFILDGQGTNSIHFRPDGINPSPITVTVAVHTPDHCETQASSIVAVKTITPPTITAPVEICPNYYSVGTASVPPDYGEYSWTVTNGYVKSGQFTNIIEFSPNGLGLPITLSVMVRSADLCDASASKTVAIKTIGAPTITAPAEICPNSYSVGTASVPPDYGEYSWTVTNGYVKSGQFTNRIEFSPNGLGLPITLSVMVRSADLCDASASTTVQIKTIPAPTITAPAEICPNSYSVGTASVPPDYGEYSWTVTNGYVKSGQFTNRIEFSPNGLGLPVTLSVMVRSTDLCDASASTTVQIKTLPAPTITASPEVCPSSYAVGTASVPPSYGDYYWSVTNGSIKSGQGTNQIEFSPNGLGSPLHINVVVRSTDLCEATASTTVQLKTISPPVITAPARVCTNVSGTASVPATYMSYGWTATNASITSGQWTNSITYVPDGNGPVGLSVQVQSLDYCSATASTSVPVTTPVTAAITAPEEVCPNAQSTASVQGGFSTYAWSITNGVIDSGADTPTVTFTAGSADPVTLSITVDAGKCSESTASATIHSCYPDPVISFASRSTDAANTLMWRNPVTGGYRRTIVRVRTDGTYPTGPTDGTEVAVVEGQRDGISTFAQSPLLNDTMHRYAAFVESWKGNFSASRIVPGRPQLTSGPVKWVYNTGATTMTPPGIGSIYAVSNDRVLHSMAPGTTGGLWPASWKPPVMNQPSQSRPSVVPMTINRIKGAAKVVFVSSQDGYVYAFDANSGAELWSTQIGTMVEGAPAVALRQYGIALLSSDLVIAGTRNSSSANGIYALETQLGNVSWSYTGDGTYKIGVISGQVWIDYPTRRIYFASYGFSEAANENHTLWCLAFDDTSVTRLWSVPLGDIDGSPMLQNNTLYVGNTSGMIYAVDPATGATLASYDTGDGAMKGFIFPISGGLYFSTLSKVWAMTDNLGSPRTLSVRWSVPLQAPSIAVGVNSALYVGSGDGKLYKFTQLTAAAPTPASVTLGTGSAAVGAIGFDYPNNLAYVGTAGGAIYAVSIP